MLSQFKAIIVNEIKNRAQYDFQVSLSVPNARTLYSKNLCLAFSRLVMSFFRFGFLFTKQTWLGGYLSVSHYSVSFPATIFLYNHFVCFPSKCNDVFPFNVSFTTVD